MCPCEGGVRHSGSCELAAAALPLNTCNTSYRMYCSSYHIHRGRNNGRSSVNFRAFFKMTAHFSTCSVRVTDHVRIIAQLV